MNEPSLSLCDDDLTAPVRAGSPPRRPAGARGSLLAGVLATALLAGCTAAGPAPATRLPDTAATTAGVAPSPTPSVGPPVVVLPEPEVLARKLAAVSRSGIGASGIVVLTGDGTRLAARGGNRPLAPASTMKVLTSLAALDLLGPDHRFTTRVVRSGKQVVLVGGGDPLLTDKASKSASKPASLQALAVATAAALTNAGVKRVTLGYDDSLFTGPDFSPGWKAKWRSWVARVSPLLVGAGRFNQWQSDPEPARTAATAFGKRLRALGIQVSTVRRKRAPAGAAELAGVESAPLSTVVRHTLRYSDNLAADVLARQVALSSGRAGSFAGASAALRAWLAGRELWSDGMRLVDGSGLAASARVTPDVLARAVVASLSDERLAAVSAGMPVAGVSGTLKDRFDDKSERIARGNVHAKTGTLIGIAALAGYLTTADGTRLAFAAVANQARGRTTAYNWLDRSAAVLVRCGCR